MKKTKSGKGPAPKEIAAWFRAKLAAQAQLVEAVHKVKDGQGKFVLLDARDPASFAAGRIPGARNVPPDGEAALPKDAEYVTYCWNAT